MDESSSRLTNLDTMGQGIKRICKESNKNPKKYTWEAHEGHHIKKLEVKEAFKCERLNLWNKGRKTCMKYK